MPRGRRYGRQRVNRRFKRKRFNRSKRTTFKRNFGPKRRSYRKRTFTRSRHRKSRSSNQAADGQRISHEQEVYGGSVVVPASSTTNKGCVYFYADRANGFVLGIDSYDMRNTAHKSVFSGSVTALETNATTGLTTLMSTIYNNVKAKVYWQRSLTTLVNMNNAPCELTVYKCRVRNDIPYLNNYHDPVWLAGVGFALAGIDGGQPNSSNTALADSAFNIMQSLTFTQNFKILKTMHHTLQPGVPKKYLLTKKKTVVYNPSRIKTWGANVTWENALRIIAQPKGCVFYLFKAEGSLGVSTSSATAPSYSANKIMYECKINMGLQGFVPRVFETASSYVGFGSGGSVVREPFDMEYKASTNL